MTQGQVSFHSLRLGELFALALGFVLCTLAVFARVYTRTRLFRPMLKEDCEFASLHDSLSQEPLAENNRCLSPCLGTTPSARTLKRVFNVVSHGSLTQWQLFFLPYIALAVVVGKHDGSPEHTAHVSVRPYFAPHLLPRVLLTNPWISYHPLSQPSIVQS